MFYYYCSVREELCLFCYIKYDVIFLKIDGVPNADLVYLKIFNSSSLKNLKLNMINANHGR